MVTGIEVVVMWFGLDGDRLEVVIKGFGLDGDRYRGGHYVVWFGW
jgi:hypothetical protein